LMLLLPFCLSNLFREEVEEHNSSHPGAAVVDPVEELIGVTNVFLRWHKLFRQTTPRKTAADINLLRTLSLRYIFYCAHYTHYSTYFLGFCLNITHIALKASIFRNYPQTEVTLTCTEHFLMIRYKPTVILCALPSPVHCCA
jgi:hypothetical protein